MKYHIIAFLVGFLLDLLLGDPYWLPHPIRLIGNLISKTETWLRKQEADEKRDLKLGRWMVFIVLFSTVVMTCLILGAAYWVHPVVGVIIETIMTYQIVATKCLKVESMKVYERLKASDIPGSRKAVSMIVGRDTSVLDAEGIAKAVQYR